MYLGVNTGESADPKDEKEADTGVGVAVGVVVVVVVVVVDDNLGDSLLGEGSTHVPGPSGKTWHQKFSSGLLLQPGHLGT